MEMPPDQARQLIRETLAPQTARERARVEALLHMAEASSKSILELLELSMDHSDLPPAHAINLTWRIFRK